MTLLTFVVVYVLMCLPWPHFQNYEKEKEEGTPIRSEKLGTEMLVPENSLKIEISFLNEKEPLKRGFWIFSRDHLMLEIRLINSSDSTFYLEPTFYTRNESNPSFVIRSKADQSFVYSKGGVRIIEIFPNWFIKMQPHSVVKDTVDVFSIDEFELTEGTNYMINAMYGNSRWGAFKDKSGMLRKLWRGSVESNVLEFKYPD